jgi:cytidylate kinase
MGSYIQEFQNNHQKEADIIVTVDGPSGSGKGTMAEYIADELGIKHFSAGDVFRSIAEDRGITHVELAENAGKEVDLEVDRRTLQRALKESCVIEGRLPSWVLGDYSDLKIFLTADKEERAKRVAGRERIDKEKALENEIKQRDKENRRRYKDYYGIDTSRTDIYDVIFDNTEMSLEKQGQLIKKILKQKVPEKKE